MWKWNHIPLEMETWNHTNYLKVSWTNIIKCAGQFVEMGPVTEREVCEWGGKGDWCCFWRLEVAVVGLFYKVEFTEFSQLAWKVGTTCSTKTMLEMQRSGTASHTRNGSGGSWCSVVGSVIKCSNGRIQQWGCMFKFANTRGLHA